MTKDDLVGKIHKTTSISLLEKKGLLTKEEIIEEIRRLKKT
jgi:hypothetical protein